MLYGALINKYFRFYNLSNGSSTTATGRNILTHQCAKINEFLTGKYDPRGKAILAGDTDSSYFSILPNDPTDIDAVIKKANDAGKYVNDSFQEFMQEQFLCNPGYDNLIKSVMEMVSDRCILIKKKKYIFHIIDSEGKRVDKIKSTGVDTKKTTIPKPISKKLNEFIDRLLKGEDWDVSIAPDIVQFKKELRTGTNLEIGNDIMILGAPIGVKNIESYTKKYSVEGLKANLPGHVAGAIHWNELLEQYGDRTSPKITSGMKIRVFYLTRTFGRFKNISVPGDIDELPNWFIDNFEPLIDKPLQLEKLVDGPIKNVIKAIGKLPPTEQSLLVSKLLVF